MPALYLPTWGKASALPTGLCTSQGQKDRAGTAAVEERGTWACVRRRGVAPQGQGEHLKRPVALCLWHGGARDPRASVIAKWDTSGTVIGMETAQPQKL